MFIILGTPPAHVDVSGLSDLVTENLLLESAEDDDIEFDDFKKRRSSRKHRSRRKKGRRARHIEYDENDFRDIFEVYNRANRRKRTVYDEVSLNSHDDEL